MARRHDFSADLLDNAGAGAGTPVAWPGGRCVVTATATGFGTGGTDIEVLGPDGSTWIAVSSLNMTASFVGSAFLPAGQIRASAGAGASGVRVRVTWTES